MSNQIIGIHDWVQTPAGRYLLDWERTHVDAAVADIFGYHALQLGLPELDGLQANRMPHQWLATETLYVPDDRVVKQAAVLCDFSALPFAPASLDLVILPHTLEFSADPMPHCARLSVYWCPRAGSDLRIQPRQSLGFAAAPGHLYRRMGFGRLFLPNAGISLVIGVCATGCAF